MSKIYEALLRAERDRTNGEQQPESEQAETAVAAEQPTTAASAGIAAASEQGALNATAYAPATEPYRVPAPWYASEDSQALPPAREDHTTFPAAESSLLLDPAATAPARAEVPARTIKPYTTPATQKSATAQAAANGTTPAEFDIIPVRGWAPSIAALPALGARGSSVEQFRSLRSRLHEFRDLGKLKSILVSSGLPQEGKSFVAANLAISFARHNGARVLLIDGDMRRSSLHKMLGAPQTPGLTEYLSRHASFTEVLQRAQALNDGIALPPGLATLAFIAGGGQSENAADLAGSERFPELLEEAAPLFDWIVVDSSPVNLVADGVNLARACDGVLMVARSGYTKLESAQRALVELKTAKMLGYVLNAVQDAPATGQYYGYDGYDSVNE